MSTSSRVNENNEGERREVDAKILHSRSLRTNFLEDLSKSTTGHKEGRFEKRRHCFYYEVDKKQGRISGAARYAVAYLWKY